jgi:hypothetical protein
LAREAHTDKRTIERARAGRADKNTPIRYVRLNDDDVRAAMEKAEVAKSGHRIENEGRAAFDIRPVLN